MENSVRNTLDDIVFLSGKSLKWAKEEAATNLSWHFQEQIN